MPLYLEGFPEVRSSRCGPASGQVYSVASVVIVNTCQSLYHIVTEIYYTFYLYSVFLRSLRVWDLVYTCDFCSLL